MGGNRQQHTLLRVRRHRSPAWPTGRVRRIRAGGGGGGGGAPLAGSPGGSDTTVGAAGFTKGNDVTNTAGTVLRSSGTLHLPDGLQSRLPNLVLCDLQGGSVSSAWHHGIRGPVLGHGPQKVLV